MTTKLISIVWIVFGIFWLIKPQALQSRFKKKSLKKIKKVLFVVSLAVGIYFVGLTFKVASWLIRVILLVAGLILIGRVSFYLRSTLSDKFLEHFSKLPPKAFRIYAGIFTAVGIILYFLK